MFDPSIHRYAADFGASFLGVLGRYAPFMLSEPIRSVTGWIIVLVLLSAGVIVLVRYREDTVLRAGALMLLLYTAGFILVRVFAYTDIEAARRSLPVVPVLALMVLRMTGRKKRLLFRLAAVAGILIGCVQAYRGYTSSIPMKAVCEAERVLQNVAGPRPGSAVTRHRRRWRPCRCRRAAQAAVQDREYRSAVGKVHLRPAGLSGRFRRLAI